MDSPLARYPIDTDFTAVIVRERHQQLQRDVELLRVAREARRRSGRTRSRFLRWR